MKHLRASILSAALLMFSISQAEAGVPVKWDVERLCQTPDVTAFPALDTLGIRAMLIDGPEYKGEKTRFFAYYALPEGADELHKVPAMVLVHGGGGSAFWEWVKVWRDRGYAAIALDTTGKFPLRLSGDPFGKTYGNWALLPDGIHLEWGDYARALRPEEEQWAYCAVAQIMLAHSFIASLPEVDGTRTGLTGNSWGGFLTLLTAAVDRRFSLAAPVYATGFYDECLTLRPKDIDERTWMRWEELWDPMHYIPEIGMPVSWAAGTNDFAFEFGALQKSFALCAAPLYRAVKHKMGHTDGHQEHGRPAETFAAADHFLKGDACALPQLGQVCISGGKASVQFSTGGRSIAKVELLYTCDAQGMWKDRAWTIVEIPCPGNDASRRRRKRADIIEAQVPQNAKTLFFNITTAEGLTASSAAVGIEESSK